MKRVIVDYKKLNKEILDLLVAKYPNGYTAMDIITFHDKDKNLINAIQVESEDTIYLVKVSHNLVVSMEEHSTDDILQDHDHEDLLPPGDDLFLDDDLDGLTI